MRILCFFDHLGRLWTACAIFCKRKNSDTFYSPRLDLNDLNVDPYFPDGTWCHTSTKQNYFCLQHQCVPEAVSTLAFITFQ